jgi:hypothetical protein
VTAAKKVRFTGTRLGIVVSIGLMIFGIVDAALPHSPVSQGGRRTGPVPRLSRATKSLATTSAPSLVGTAAERVAEEFVAATDTTDPAHPQGATAEQIELAQGLAAPRLLAWPEAWVAENRRTTVVLDSPGPVVVVGTGQVAVVVTGRMVVTADTGPSTEVPVDERITMQWVRSEAALPPHGTSHWVVTDVGTGS